MRNYAYKVRIYPDEEQANLIVRTFGCARLVWNLMLLEALENYKKEKKFNFSTPATFKTEERAFLKDVDCMALCNAQLNLKGAFSDYSADKKDPTKQRKRGFPKLKKRRTAKKAYTTNNGNNDKIRAVGHYLKLPKLGLVKAVFHRRIEGKIKSVTISQTSSGMFFASILVELPDVPYVKPDLDKVVGLDFSFSNLFVTSVGTKTKYTREFKALEKKLGKAQRRLSKKVFGSAGYEKQRRKVARIHETIANRRLDCLLKLAKTLIDQYDVIVVEDIDLVGMARKGKRRRFGKTIMDLGFGLFRSILERKCSERGKLFIKAPRFFASTQTCSVCGFKNTELKGMENLGTREWTCPHCGTHHDRDVNAAQCLVRWFKSIINTGALPGINADGDVVSTSKTVRSKRRRGYRKNCKTVDLTSPSLQGGVC